MVSGTINSCFRHSSEYLIVKISVPYDEPTFPTLTNLYVPAYRFERQIRCLMGIAPVGHPDSRPWIKFEDWPANVWPLRKSFNPQTSMTRISGEYHFARTVGEGVIEIPVGPVHAGIIEPGHFRFVCNGEQILHLEIQLGYQHRGVEELFLKKNNLRQRITLSESIAGDTAVGHAVAFANLWESLCGYHPDEELQFVRTIALELERIAVHTGDLSAICGDIAYQLGQSVFGRLRTPIINFLQSWCGSRLGKGLIRPAENHYPFTFELRDSLLAILEVYERDFNEMIKKFFHNPGSLTRLEKTGVVSYEQALEIGAVGMAAKASGLSRDIRSSHPFGLFKSLQHEPVIKHHGDVYSRTQMRRVEILQSIGYIKKLLENIPKYTPKKDVLLSPGENKFVISLVEGWRGEICHCAVTNDKGELIKYKIKDPSFHNWIALALAVRKNEISDFPICNKSFNLSYCGFDL